MREELTEAATERMRDYSDAQRDFAVRTLASAGEDGVVLAPGNMTALALYQHFIVFGWLDRKLGRKGGPYVITSAGRAALKGGANA